MMGTRTNRFCLFLLFLNSCIRFNDGKKGFLEEKMESVTTVAGSMAAGGNLNEMADTEMDSKLDTIRNKAKKIDEDSHEGISDAVGDVGDGLSSLVKGIQTGSAVDIISGGLSIITSITELFDPKLAVLTEVLGLISIVFSLFGGSTGGESTEGMMKRVIEKAIADAKAEELQAEVNGLKRLYNSLQSSIKAFKKAGAVSPEQTREFYTKGFRGIRFFGIMEHYINKWCDIGDAKTYDYKLPELEEKTTRCLLMCNLYADLSILRQILLADLAAFLAEIGKEHESDNLLYLIKEEQKSDRNIFKFIVDPIDYRNSRYVNVKYYSRYGQYPTLSAYLINLDNEMYKENEGRYFKPSVMVCDDVHLKGNCYSYSKLQNVSNVQEWNDKISSVYISPGRGFTAWKDSRYLGDKYGPYYGPSVYTTIAGDNVWTSFTIEETTKNSNDMIRICEGENLDINSKCVVIAKASHSILSTAGGQDWNDQVGSLTIPAGVKIYGYEHIHQDGKEYGPFYGPDTLNKLCAPQTWSSLKVFATTSSATTIIKVCAEENLSGICCHVDVPTDTGDEKDYKSVDNLCGCDWTKTSLKIKSMKIPGGMKVEVFSDKDYGGRVYGPFTGPATLSRVDGSVKSDEYVKSFKVTKLF